MPEALIATVLRDALANRALVVLSIALGVFTVGSITGAATIIPNVGSVEASIRVALSVEGEGGRAPAPAVGAC